MSKEFPTQGNAQMNDDNQLVVEIAGGIASGAVDSGDPIKVAGKYNATKPTFIDGQRGDLQIDNRGRLVTTESASTVLTGRKSSIGLTALQLTTTSTKCTGVYMKALSTNTAVVYVGLSGVTANSADGTDGYPLEQGDSIFIGVIDPSLLYVISTATGQSVFYMINY